MRKRIPVAIRYLLLVVALASAAPRTAEAESTTEEWEAAVADVRALIDARTKDVREFARIPMFSSNS